MTNSPSDNQVTRCLPDTVPKATLLCALLWLCALLSAGPALSQDFGGGQALPEESDSPLKYAIYSSAWGESSNAGLRLVAQNRSDNPILLDSILFSDEIDPAVESSLDVNLIVPPQGWAEIELPYFDLLFGAVCITRTMAENWKLVEVSNYTLNPSVRGLIIEDTDSFRIYQCIRNVFVSWLDTETGETTEYAEWVMYHFERRPIL
ncbi:MAG: hypothetical protein Q8L60_08610 [Gammaproteobacteria bacterium]|nr:hypothetical protein [Gammaproteobacteria bacterium]MDP2140232.1 hypothetical protein [Gammaproteobacteria bacterium]MDP2348108.1 hypothetical protein [Gammaproteobacteria bacterium]